MDEIGLPYAIMRTKKLTDWGSVSVTLQHNCRTRPTENADLNGHISILIGSNDPKEIIEDMESKLQNITVRKNAVLAFEVLLAASPEFFRTENLSVPGVYDEQRKNSFVENAMQWAETCFAKENIVSAVLHVDESTPHLQLVILPIDPRGKLNASYWLDGSKKLSEMQDAFAEYMKPLGLRRGLRGSQAKHEPVKHFYFAANKPVAKELALPNVPKKWDREPSWYSDLWTYPEMKEKSDIALEAHLKGKKKRENILKQNFQIKEDNKLKANALDLAQRKQKEAVNTAEKLSNENEQLRAKASLLRALPLAYVLLKIYQIKINNQNPIGIATKKYTLPDGRIVIISKDDKGELWSFDDGKKHRGAIDLVKHLDGLNYDQSLRLLSEYFDEKEVVADQVNHTIPMILAKAQQNKQSQLVPTPASEPALWPKLFDWLTNTHKLPKKLINWLHQHGVIYADVAGNAVFKRKNGGAFIQGVKTFFHRDVGSSDCGPFIIPGTSSDFYITKNLLSACAIKATHSESTILAFGKNQIDFNQINDLTSNGSNIILAGELEGRQNNLDYLKLSDLKLVLPPDGESWCNSILQNPNLIANEWLDDNSDEMEVSNSLKLQPPK